MLYESYRAKLAKRRRAFERVWRFRLLILLGVAVLLALAASLLGVKGMVYGEAVPGSVVYGEPLSATAQAVLGDAVFEYRAMGTEAWTREEPIYAGEYECRAVGVSSAGTARAGKIYAFRILPVQVEVSVENAGLIYGEAPTFSAPLRYGDTLHVGNFFAEEEGEVVHVTADLNSVTALNADGEDVSASYRFVSVEKDVVDIYREITVRTPDVTFEYDGTAHGSEAEISNLVEGHRAEATLPTLTEAGTCKNEVQSLKIFDENGEDVTHRYRINYEIGHLTVTKRRITVQTPSEELAYDGNPHEFALPGLAEGTLAEGQKLQYTALSPVVDAGSYRNERSVSVFEGERDVTPNYEIAEDFGTVTIAPLAITVKTESETLAYDGEAHTYQDIDVTSGELAKGQILQRRDTLTAQDAGTYANTPTFEIVSGNQAISKENYVITEDFGTVTIAPLAITVTTKTETLAYDGQAHPYHDIKVSSGELAKGQELQRKDTLTAQDAGTYANTPIFDIISGEEEISKDNYVITEDFGTVTVTPLEITVKTESETLDYDGKAHPYHDIKVSSGELAKGQELQRKDTLTAQDAGTYTNTPTFEIVSGKDEISKDNYVITEDFGTVEIAPLEITVKTESETLDYDGKAHPYHDIKVSSGELAKGQELQRKDTLTAQDAGTYTNTPTFEIVSGNQAISKENYVITEDFGTVTISKRVLHVTAKSEEFTYDGKEHVYGSDTFTEDGSLAPDQEYHLENVLVAKDADTYTNAPEVTILASGEDVTKNYDFKLIKGTVTIEQRPITITTQDKEWIYDGADHIGEYEIDISYPEEGLGHTVTPTFTPYKTAGEHTNTCTVQIFDGKENVTENYEIGYENVGKINIAKREVTFGTQSHDPWVYDGKPHSHSAIELREKTTLAPSQNFSFTVEGELPSHTNVKKWNNQFTYEVTITDESGEAVTTNYTINYSEVWGELEITKRPITFGTKSHSWEYDGEEHKLGEIEIRKGEPAEGQEFSFEVKGELLSRTDASEWDNEFTYEVTIKDDKDRVVTENYDITYSEDWGELAITQRRVTLQTGSNSWEYDGEKHKEESYKEVENKLVEGHRVEVTYSSAVQDVSKTPNMVNEESCKILTASGEDVTRNYVITWAVPGTLEVYARRITVNTGDGTWTYDGDPHAQENCSVEREKADGQEPLADGQKLVLTYPQVTKVADTFDNNNVPTEWKFEKDGNEIWNGNYDIKWVYGTLTIEPRPITITTQDKEWTYDDTDHVDEYQIEVAHYLGIDLGHTVMPTFEPYKTAGEHINTCTAVAITDGNGDDVTENYAPEVHNTGIITIARRPITITTRDQKWTYDGTSHADETALDITYFKGEALFGHTVTPTFTPHTEVGSYNNECTVEIFDEYSSRVTDNYEISYENTGKIDIIKRHMKFTTGSETWVYDGEEHFSEQYTAEEFAGDRGLVLGQSISFDATRVTDVTDKDGKVQTVLNEWENIRIYDDLGIDRTGNYEIETEWGSLRVKSPIVIRISTVSREYDGTPLSFTSDDWRIEKLPVDVTEDQVKVELRGSLTTPGELTLDEVRGMSTCTVAAGPDDVNRIDFSGSEIPLRVEKRVLRIITASIEGVRGEEPIQGTDTQEDPYWISFGSLADGQKFAESVQVTGELSLDENEAENTLTQVIILDAEGNDVTDCYDIEVTCGTLSWSVE